MKYQRFTQGMAAIVAMGLLTSCAQDDWQAESEKDAGLMTAVGKTLPTTPIGSAAGAERAPEKSAERKPVIIRGTGQLINRTVASRVDVEPMPSGDLTLNFVNADIRDVLRSVLGMTLNRNYTIHPAIQGTVTLNTTRPVARSALIPILETLLRQNGAVMIERGGIMRIVPAAEAMQSVRTPRLAGGLRGGPAGYSGRILPLRFISASAMADILKPFLPADQILRVDTQRNLLILAGTTEELNNASELVRTFDVDWFAGNSFAFIPLKQAQPSALVPELDAVFGDHAEGPLAGLVRFVPMDRINSILVVTSRPTYLRQARAWIERLDLGAETVEPRLFVYRVQNARATDLAEVLAQLYGGGGPARTQTTLGGVAPGRQATTLRTPTSTASASPTPATRTSATGTSTTAQRQTTTGTTTQPGTASGSTGRTPARAQTGAAATQAVSSVQIGETTRIIADDINNSLLILAPPAEYRQIAAALDRLDTVPIQVLIQATIAEVTLNEELRYGVQWFFREGNHAVTLSNLETGAVAATFPGFAYLFNGGANAQAVLDALDGVTDVNLLSSPQVIVKDNRTATIEVGDQVPIATQTSQSATSADANLINTIQFRDTGVLLEVTPRVNSSGLVSLDISQEVSSAKETDTSGIDSPTIQQRKVQSSVIIHDGETIALGGLIQSRRERGRTGIPILSRIPILGHLFGATNELHDRTELLVLITPRVIRSREEARKITEELRDRIRVLRRPKDDVQGGEGQTKEGAQ